MICNPEVRFERVSLSSGYSPPCYPHSIYPVRSFHAGAVLHIFIQAVGSALLGVSFVRGYTIVVSPLSRTPPGRRAVLRESPARSANMPYHLHDVGCVNREHFQAPSYTPSSVPPCRAKRTPSMKLASRNVKCQRTLFIYLFLFVKRLVNRLPRPPPVPPLLRTQKRRPKACCLCALLPCLHTLFPFLLEQGGYTSNLPWRLAWATSTATCST